MQLQTDVMEEENPPPPSPLHHSLWHYCVQCKQAQERRESEACGWKYQRDKCVCLVEPKGAELKMTWLLFVLSALTCSHSKTIENKHCSGSAENRRIQHAGRHEGTAGQTSGHAHTYTQQQQRPVAHKTPVCQLFQSPRLASLSSLTAINQRADSSVTAHTHVPNTS